MKRAAAVGALLLLAAGVGALAAGQPDGPPAATEQTAARERELERIRGEIARLQAQYEKAKQAESGIAGDLERTSAELALQEQRLAEASAAREVAGAKVAESEQRIADLEARLTRLRDELRGSLVGLYRMGHNGYLRLFMALRPSDSMLPGIRLLRFIARRDANALESFRAAETELAVERDGLLKERQEVEAWVAREQSRRSALAQLRARQKEQLAGSRDEQARLSERRGELVDREQKLATFLDLLARDVKDLGGKPIGDFRGILDWPVRGRVIHPFGPRLDPRYGTKVPHNGVDLAPETPADEVRAVYPGRVLFAAPFEGFGTTVVLFHAGRGLTLYGGLASARVAKDDVVALGTALGGAGDIVYFEIRVDNKPEDPSRWLR